MRDVIISDYRKNSDIENILNTTAKGMFNKSVDLTFKITPSQQVQLFLSGPLAGQHPYLKNRIISKVHSNSILSEIRRRSTNSSYANIVLNLLKSVTVGKFDWNKYIEFDLNIDKDVLEKAREAIKDHVEGIEEFFIEPITEAINDITPDSNAFNSLWTELFGNTRTLVNSLDSFKEYTTIKEEVIYPYLELGCKTGKVRVTEDSTGHFIKVENNDYEIEKLKQTLNILQKESRSIKKFIEINSIIDDIIREGAASSFDIDETQYNKDNCISMYKNKMDRAISKDMLDGKLKIKSTTYDILSIDTSIIKEALVSLSDTIATDIKNQVEQEIIKMKEKFNKPYTVEILTLINDFSKKGITTYVSILSGEKGSKITSNRYDTSESYGCMQSYTKEYITNTLRDFIDSGLIIEERYKASFGRYTGLNLSKDSKEFINNCNKAILSTNTNTPDIKIDNLETLLNELRLVPSSRAIALLKKCSEEAIPFEKKDFNILLKFIDKERALYRDYEETFNTCISKIVPSIYRPLFLLNSNFANGVNKKTLKAIYDIMETSD